MKEFLRSYLFKPTALRIGILITGFSLLLSLVNPGFLERLELAYYDLKMVDHPPVKPLDKVVLVAIDEKSLDEIGRWPWPRTKIAELVDRLTESGARVIGFDVVFPEPDENSALKQVQSLKEKVGELGGGAGDLGAYLAELERNADTDRVLTDAVKRSGRVILGYFFHEDYKEAQYIPEAKQEENFNNIIGSAYAVKFSSPKAANIHFEKAYAAEANLKMFCAAAKGSGYFNVSPDEDGVVRWLPLITACKDEIFPPLALHMLRL